MPTNLKKKAHHSTLPEKIRLESIGGEMLYDGKATAGSQCRVVVIS